MQTYIAYEHTGLQQELYKILDKDLVEIIEQEDVDGLIKLPFVWKHIDYAICVLVATGKWNFLNH